MSEFRDYENGVADVLAFLANDSATVDRTVRLVGKRSKRKRQVDVLVRGRIFGGTDATMIVDCKRRKTKIDVKAVESFIGMVEDVGAEIGMIVASSGTTAAARERAHAERGVRLEALSLEELVRWSPEGTVSTTYGVAPDKVSAAERALREAGFRVRSDRGYEARDGEALLCAFRHTGERQPSGESQRELLEAAEAALRSQAISARHVANGVTFAGGTPAHQWLKVLVAGVLTDVKVLARSSPCSRR